MNYLLLSLLVVTYVSAFDLLYFHDNLGNNISIFTNSTLNTSFIYSESKCCSLPILYINNDKEDILNFTLFKEQGSNFESNNLSLILSNEKISAGNIKDSVHTYPIFQREDIIEIQMLNLCNSHNITRLNGIQFSFTLNNTRHKVEFFKECEDVKVEHPSYYIRDYICISLSVLIILISTKYSNKKHSTYMNQENNSSIYKIKIEWWYGILFATFAFISILLVVFFGSTMISYFSVAFYCALILTIGASIGVIVKKLLKRNNVSVNNKTFLKSEIIKKLKVYHIVSGLIGLMLTIVFTYFHYWYISNLFFFGFIYGLLAILSINTFSDILLINVCLVAYDIYWLFWILFFNVNYREYAMKQFCQPLNLVVKVSDNFFSPCIFISGWDCLIVGLIIKYSKHFDRIKGKVTEEYYKISIILLVIGSTVSYLLQLLFPRALILGIPTQIVLIMGLAVASYLKGDGNDFWSGKNNGGIHKAVNEIIEGDFEEYDDKEDKINKITNEQYNERVKVDDLSDGQNGFKQVSK